MPYADGIEKGIKEKDKEYLIARKIYLSYPTFIFRDRLDVQFDILNKVSEKFNLQYNCIQIVGSAKTGYSYHKGREFEMGKSDLDVAIISEDLFIKYMQIAFRTTAQYSDLSKFRSTKYATGTDIYKQFIDSASKGYFRPDLMPFCTEKTEWFNFFNQLSDSYYELFKNINAGIYINQYFYEQKQVHSIKKYRKRG